MIRRGHRSRLHALCAFVLLCIAFLTASLPATCEARELMPACADGDEGACCCETSAASTNRADHLDQNCTERMMPCERASSLPQDALMPVDSSRFAIQPLIIVEAQTRLVPALRDNSAVPAYAASDQPLFLIHHAFLI